jgi:hypothetical protein
MIRLTIAYVIALAAVLLIIDFGVMRTAVLYVQQLPLVDKLVHFWMFGLFALLVWSLSDLAANYLGVLCVGVLPLIAWPRHRTRPANELSIAAETD